MSIRLRLVICVTELMVGTTVRDVSTALVDDAEKTYNGMPDAVSQTRDYRTKGAKVDWGESGVLFIINPPYSKSIPNIFRCLRCRF